MYQEEKVNLQFEYWVNQGQEKKFQCKRGTKTKNMKTRMIKLTKTKVQT